MESPTLALMFVRADTSEYVRAELAAFVETNKRLRPAPWALVEQLQRACLSESPATPAGLREAARVVQDAQAMWRLGEEGVGA